MPADLYRRNARGIAGYLFSGAMARESLWIVARSVPLLEPLVARLTTGLIFKFPIPRVDDINALRPDFDVAGFYKGKMRSPTSGASPIPRAAAQLAEGYDYDAMVRTFERDAIGLIASNPGRHVRYLLCALFDPAFRGDARCVSRDAEDRL